MLGCNSPERGKEWMRGARPGKVKVRCHGVWFFFALCDLADGEGRGVSCSRDKPGIGSPERRWGEERNSAMDGPIATATAVGGRLLQVLVPPSGFRGLPQAQAVLGLEECQWREFVRRLDERDEHPPVGDRRSVRPAMTMRFGVGRGFPSGLC